MSVGGSLLRRGSGERRLPSWTGGSSQRHVTTLVSAERIVGRTPSVVSHVQAAAITLTELTDVSALEETLQLRSAQTILRPP